MFLETQQNTAKDLTPMPDQFEHYITKNIKSFYKCRLLTPILYLIFLLVLWFVLSLSAPLFPDTLDAPDTLESTYRRHEEYISATLSDLKFTGYTQSFLGHISGYYYYTMRNDECIIVLLSPNTSEQGLPEIPQVSVRAKILHGSENFDELLNHLASDLNWTENGIHNKVSQYVLSEPDYNLLGNTLLYVVFFATGGYALICIVFFILYICFQFSRPRARISRCSAIRKSFWSRQRMNLRRCRSLQRRICLSQNISSSRPRCTAMPLYRSMRSSGSTNTRRSTSFLVPLQHLLHAAYQCEPASLHPVPEEHQVGHRRYHGLPRRGEPQYFSRILRSEPSEGAGDPGNADAF